MISGKNPYSQLKSVGNKCPCCKYPARAASYPHNLKATMKKILLLLLVASQALMAQRNVALLNMEPSFRADYVAAPIEFSEIPFQFAGGMVIVKASVNGEMGNFILDTGAPGIVLNAQNEDIQSATNASSVGGGMLVGEVVVQNFQLGFIKLDKAQGHMLDVHHLEAACGMDLMGLIGFDVLRNYELLFDFPNSKISAFKSGTGKDFLGHAPKLTFSFTLCGHVPVIVAKVGNKRVFLGLDSGAEVNLLDAKYFDKITSSHLSNIQTELLTGLDKMTNTVVAADVSSTRIKNETLPEMRFVFADLSHLQHQFNIPLDGLLGIPFFKERVISIDYKQKEISIWD